MMKHRKSSRIKPLHLLVFVLLLVLPCLALFQYRWIGELNRLEEEHLRRSIESSANQLSWALSQKFYLLARSFMIRPDLETQEQIAKEMQRRLEDYEQIDTSTFLRGLYFITNKPNHQQICIWSNNQAEYPDKAILPNSELDLLFKAFDTDDPMMQPARFWGGWSRIIMPIRGAHEFSGIAVFDVDSTFIGDSVLTQLINEFFPFRAEQKLEFAILGTDDSIFYYRTDGFPSQITDESGIIGVNIGYLAPFGKKVINKPNLPDNPDRKFDGRIKHNGNNDFRHGRSEPEPPKDHDNQRPRFEGNFIQDAPSATRLYRFVVSSRSGDVSEVVHTLRWKNLAISFSVLILLVLIIALIIYLSSKSQKIAQQKMQFISGLSHELRTPVTVVRTAGDNLSAGISASEEKVKAYGQLIKREIDRLWDMLETILFYTGFDSDRQMITPKEIKLADFISRIINAKQSKIEDQKLIYNFSADGSAASAMADENSLTIALNNIIDNAIKFNTRAGTLSVEIKQSNKDAFVDIIVTDSGMGISRNDLKSIFEPFYRSRAAFDKNIQGSGIGLSLVKKIASRNGWRISIDSAIGKGTKFIISLPIKQD